jgi:biotin carboxylase
MRPYREYLLKSIASRFRVHLLHAEPPGWETQYLAGWTVVPDTCDGPAMAAVAARLHAETPVSGVLCWDEIRIRAAAHVAQELGLPNGDPEMVWRMRDKAQTRVAVATAGVPQPVSIPVGTVEDALAAAGRLGYPVILKPRGLGASLGVVRADDADQLRAGFAFTSAVDVPAAVTYNSPEPFLVEECVIGEEISIDAAVHGGVVAPVFVARKVVGYFPYAEEVGHFVDAADPLLTDPELLRALEAVHRGLGFRDGWTHTEFMLTADGPKLIEVNGRLGGDLIPYLGQLATGVDPGLAAASLACGSSPDLAASRKLVAAVRFFYVQKEETKLGSVEFLGRLCEEVDRTVVLAPPGSVVSPPPKGTVWGRIAYATAVAESPDACRAALDGAEAALVVTPDA